MARAVSRLTARTVQTVVHPGKYADGDGLYLVVDAAGNKRWSLLVSVSGRRREFGLGKLTKENGLGEARRAAAAMREAIRKGEDPKRKVENGLTFKEAALRVIESLSPGWRGANTEDGWRRNLTVHAARIGSIPLDRLTTDDILGVVRPYWTEKPETGGKMRDRIETVLDAAIARGWMEGPNPARWKGHMAFLLPRRKRLTRGHHAALPYDQAPAFMATLSKRSGYSARALEFTVLTAAREGMVLGAKAREIVGTEWRIPKERMKSERDMVVPLSTQALQVLRAGVLSDPDGYIFPGARRGTALSNASMDKMARAVGGKVTVHGFRSTFKDWANDETDFPDEVSELALAHKVGSSTRRAYRREDALEKRRELMQHWADYLLPGRPESGAVPPDE